MSARTYRTAAFLAVTLAVAAVAVTVLAGPQPGPTAFGSLCCVAGNYRGSQTPDPLPNCPVPKAELFSMTISQAPGCGSSVWGQITDASGHVYQYKGTLRRGTVRGCCVLEGSFSDPANPAHVVKFMGNMCLQLGKWQAIGTFSEVNSGDACKKGGVWKILQN